ncbi:MAG: YaiI/YqxD family protein [Hyphomicrobium sp.]|nr:YaiI/YqxD family protein [Hyphomicrobium sp.]
MHIYIDADACPVKDEALKVADRHGLPISYVSNNWMRLPEGERVERVIVAEGPDAADDWIAARAGPGDIVVTQDIPLAARCLKAGARVIGNSGKAFDDRSIGMALAMRELNQHLRETGVSRGLNASFMRQDRSRFLEAMEQAVQNINRG